MRSGLVRRCQSPVNSMSKGHYHESTDMSGSCICHRGKPLEDSKYAFDHLHDSIACRNRQLSSWKLCLESGAIVCGLAMWARPNRRQQLDMKTRKSIMERGIRRPQSPLVEFHLQAEQSAAEIALKQIGEAQQLSYAAFSLCKDGKDVPPWSCHEEVSMDMHELMQRYL